MPLTRTFRGRVVVHTKRIGPKIELTYAGLRGFEKQREIVPFDVYEREVRKDFSSARPVPPGNTPSESGVSL